MIVCVCRGGRVFVSLCVRLSVFGGVFKCVS